jgi:hypothetical protein
MIKIILEENKMYNTSHLLTLVSKRNPRIKIVSVESSIHDYDGVCISFTILNSVDDIINFLINVIKNSESENINLEINFGDIIIDMCTDDIVIYYKIYGVNKQEYNEIVAGIKSSGCLTK